MCEGRRAQRSEMNPTRQATLPPSLALPSPALKRGTFYFAKKRNFLNCVDTGFLIEWKVGRWLEIGYHEEFVDAAKSRG
jgi:hypothetical protein